MCCSCGGADSRARHCTGETNGPSLKWQMSPNCHCEERSDVAISQYPAASWESNRRNRNCLPEIAPQGHFLALRAQGATSACGLLAMTNLRTSRHRMCAAKIASLHGAQRTPLQTQLVHTVLSTAGTSRKCLPEIATSAVGLLAMTIWGPFPI